MRLVNNNSNKSVFNPINAGKTTLNLCSKIKVNNRISHRKFFEKSWTNELFIK